MSKWIEFDVEYERQHVRLVVPDAFDPDNEEHVQYLWDNIDLWAEAEIEQLERVRNIATPGPVRTRIVDGMGPDAKVIRIEMRDPRPDGEILDGIPLFAPPAPAVPVVDPNQGVLEVE